MKKAHREIAGLRGHSTLTKAEQFSPVAWSVATMRTVLVDGKIVCLVFWAWEPGETQYGP